MAKSQLREAQLELLVEQMYSAVLQPEHWASVLDSLNRTFLSRVAIIFGQSRKTRNLTFLEAIGPNDGQFRQFSEYYIHKDPRITGTDTRAVGSPVAEWGLMSARQWRSTEMYYEFSRRFGIPYLLGANLVNSAEERVICSLNRPHRAFSVQELEFMRILLPHLSRAVKVSQRLAQFRLSAAATFEALNQLPFSFFLLSEDSAIVEASDRARVLLSRNDALRVQDNVLRAYLDSDTNEMQRAVSACCDVARLIAAPGPTALRIASRDPAPPLLGYVLPYAAPGGPSSVALLVVVEQALAMIEGMQKYSLSPTERRVLQALVCGHGPIAIADLLGRSVHTVRSAIKRILAKTEMPSQSAVIALALKGSPASGLAR